jgi:hypothetical protein
VPRYHFVPESSRMWIGARSTLHAVNAECDGVEGYVDLVLRSDDEGEAAAEVPDGRLCLAVGRLSSGNRMQDREMRRHIEARRYPTIAGVLTGVRWLGTDGAYQVSGEVQFRGITRRYEDQMQVEELDDRTIRISGVSRFDVRDFGMAPPRMLFLSVEPHVDVGVDIVARLRDSSYDDEGTS